MNSPLLCEADIRIRPSELFYAASWTQTEIESNQEEYLLAADESLNEYQSSA